MLNQYINICPQKELYHSIMVSNIWNEKNINLLGCQ